MILQSKAEVLDGYDRSLILKVVGSNGSHHILCNLSAFTTGLALEMASLPGFLKSKVHPCCSGYLWTPQNVIPHLHRNPVNPTLFRQVEHLLGRVDEGAAATAPGAVISLAASGKVKAGGERGAVDEEEAAAAEAEGDESDFSTADLTEEACSSLRRRSP